MANFGSTLWLLLVFPVVGFINLYACQVAAAANELPQNTDHNSTTSLYTKRLQQRERLKERWESPASMLSMNHQQNTELGGGISTRFAVPFQIVSPLPSFIGVDASLLRPQQAKTSAPTLQAQPQSQQQLPPSTLNDRVADSIANSVFRFGIEVGTLLSENAYYSKSEIFSPLSIMSALSLLVEGAKGQSYQQLKPIFGPYLDNSNYAQLLHKEFGYLLEDIEKNNIQALHHSNNAQWRDTPILHNIRFTSPSRIDPSDHVIKIANGVFTQTGYSLNLNYKNVLQTIYRSEFAQLDFQNKNEDARQRINAWVSKNTYGKIPNIISNAIPQSTKMILASVLYFKGFWENTFFEAATTLDNFFPEGETKAPIKVQMMATGGAFPYYESPDLNCRIIGLPYKGNLTTMYIIQPKQSSIANLKDFQSKITAEFVDDLISKMAYRSAVVAFPKIHVERQINLKEILRSFGVTDIFSNGASDLSLIGGIQNVYQSIPRLIRPATRPFQANTQDNVQGSGLLDRYNEKPLFFSSRFGTIADDIKINCTAENTIEKTTPINNTITVTENNAASTSKTRKKRQILNIPNPLSLLEAERQVNSSPKSDLYVEDILHKVNFEVNEQGTEAAAATLTYLRRSGTDIVFRAETPFILLIRHDPSKLVLFYGIVNEPET